MIQTDPAREDQVRNSYRFDLQAKLTEKTSLATNYLIIQQDPTMIRRLSVSVIGQVPKLKIPFRSFLMGEWRDLEDLPQQSHLSLETRLNYRFRQIAIVVSHSYIKESLLVEEYAFQEVRGSISRYFKVF